MRQKFEKINELRVGSILTYLNLFISCSIPLLYTPIMLRILGQAEYGLYGLSNSVIGYLSLLNFGMGSAVIRYITKCRVEKDHCELEKVAGLFIFVYTVLAVAVCIVGGSLTQFSGVFFGTGLKSIEIIKLNKLIIIMTISTAISFPVSVYSSIIIAYEKYIFRKIIDSVVTVATPVLNLIVLYFGYATTGMAFIGLVSQILYLIIFVWYSKKKLDISPKFCNMPFYMLKEIIGFSAFVFLSSIIDMLYWATDKVLIGAMVGTVSVAVYNIGGTFTSMLQNMSSAISGVFGTRVTAMVLSKRPIKDLSELLIRVGRLQYLIVSFFLSGYVVFGQTFILLWAGKGYEQAYYVGLLTMIPLAVPLIQNIAFTTIVAQNRHRFRAVVYGFIAVGNVISTYLCIPQYGVIGAAVCTGTAYVLGNGIIMNIYYYKVTQLDIPQFWKNIIKMSVVPVTLSIIGIVCVKMVISINTIYDLLIAALSFSIIFAMGSWLLSMNTYEKDLIREVLGKVLKIK